MKPYIDCGVFEEIQDHSEDLIPSTFGWFIKFEDKTEKVIKGFESEEEAVNALEDYLERQGVTGLKYQKI